MLHAADARSTPGRAAPWAARPAAANAQHPARSTQHGAQQHGYVGAHGRISMGHGTIWVGMGCTWAAGCRATSTVTPLISDIIFCFLYLSSRVLPHYACLEHFQTNTDLSLPPTVMTAESLRLNLTFVTWEECPLPSTKAACETQNNHEYSGGNCKAIVDSPPSPNTGN